MANIEHSWPFYPSTISFRLFLRRLWSSIIEGNPAKQEEHHNYYETDESEALPPQRPNVAGLAIEPVGPQNGPSILQTYCENDESGALCLQRPSVAGSLASAPAFSCSSFQFVFFFS